MPQTVEEKVLADAGAGGHALTARRLFIVFCALAFRNYQYSATKVVGSEGSTLLARPEDEIVTVDCASLADAFVELVNKTIPTEKAERVDVVTGDGFATRKGGRCFDARVVGNVRMPGGTWAETGRCVFREHYFVVSGSGERMHYDPCMFTTYGTKAEVMDWKFESGGGAFNSIVKKIVGDPTRLLLRLPPNYTGAKPPGFNSGMIIFKTSDFKKNEYAALAGRRLKPAKWSDDDYAGHAADAMSRINTLLRDKAGVAGSWA